MTVTSYDTEVIDFPALCISMQTELDKCHSKASSVQMLKIIIKDTTEDESLLQTDKGRVRSSRE